jgi:hypothetical protein
MRSGFTGLFEAVQNASCCPDPHLGLTVSPCVGRSHGERVIGAKFDTDREYRKCRREKPMLKSLVASRSRRGGVRSTAGLTLLAAGGTSAGGVDA